MRNHIDDEYYIGSANEYFKKYLRGEIQMTVEQREVWKRVNYSLHYGMSKEKAFEIIGEWILT